MCLHILAHSLVYHTGMQPEIRRTRQNNRFYRVKFYFFFTNTNSESQNRASFIQNMVAKKTVASVSFLQYGI
jgi:hypothetical protein